MDIANAMDSVEELTREQHHSTLDRDPRVSTTARKAQTQRWGAKRSNTTEPRQEATESTKTRARQLLSNLRALLWPPSLLAGLIDRLFLGSPLSLTANGSNARIAVRSVLDLWLYNRPALR